MEERTMKKRVILFLLTIVIIQHNISADIMTELAKRDSKNPIRLAEYSGNVLYAKDGYLHTEYWSDTIGELSIVAYKIDEDAIKLILRMKTWDFAYRIFDYFYERDGIDLDQFTVEVHNYYLLELVYVNDRLETYCNRIRDINTNGFIFNDAEISGNINEASDYHPTYPYLETELTEGMKIKVAALINERTNATNENSHEFKTYDYYYHILVDDRQVRINGYLLDFSDKIDYRATLLILGSGNTPQATPPEEALDYFGTWRYTGTGGMGFDEYRRTITITISADGFNYHYAGYEREYGYTLTDLMWTRIIRPDEDFKSWVEILVDNFKGASGFLITGTVINKTGDWPDTDSITEYVYLRPDNKDRMCWYNFYMTNYILVRQK
jgi:hypothetical protein